MSLLTVGDSAGGARLVGIPDGMGAFDNNDGTFTVLVNHELNSSQGIVRAHGGIGAFVSKWIVDKNTLAVLSGSDQIQTAFLWNTGTMVYDQVMNAVFSRFCSGDLAPASAFFNAASLRSVSARFSRRSSISPSSSCVVWFMMRSMIRKPSNASVP